MKNTTTQDTHVHTWEIIEEISTFFHVFTGWRKVYMQCETCGDIKKVII